MVKCMKTPLLTIIVLAVFALVACGFGASDDSASEEESAFRLFTRPAAPAPAATAAPAPPLKSGGFGPPGLPGFPGNPAAPARPALPAPAPPPVPAPAAPAAPAQPAPERRLTGEKDADFGGLDLTDLNEQVASLVTQQRIIVRTVEMGLLVSNVAGSIDDISQLAQELGGWVVNTDRSRKHNGSISIRVPATSLDEAVSRLRGSAVDVEFEISTSRDVTDEFVDTTARLTNLEATEAALLRLLDRADKVEEALSVQRELTRIQEEVERLQGRIKFLEQTAAFSLINIDLRLEPMDMPVDAGLNQTFSVGQVARFRATFQPPEDIDDFTFTWDFGDGTREIQASRTAPTVNERTRITATITHIYDDDRDSPYIVVLKMTGTGDAGLAEGEDTIIATVTKIPTIEVFAGESKNVEQGEEVEFLGSFTRPEGLDDLTFKWDFGDGSAPVTGSLDEGVTNAIATHEYPDPRPFPFNATLTIMAQSDAGEVEAQSSLTIFVEESEGIAIFAGDSITVEQGEEVEFIGSFTRPEGLSDWTFSWDFGDGSAPATGTLEEGVTNAIVTHEYPNHRPFPFTATLTISAKRNAREVESENTLTVFVEESEGWVIAGWSANDDGKTAVRALSAVGQSLGTFFIWLGIFSPVWIVLGIVGIVVVRRRRSSAL